jgi:hypothetical protein
VGDGIRPRKRCRLSPAAVGLVVAALNYHAGNSDKGDERGELAAKRVAGSCVVGSQVVPINALSDPLPVAVD